LLGSQEWALVRDHIAQRMATLQEATMSMDENDQAQMGIRLARIQGEYQALRWLMHLPETQVRELEAEVARSVGNGEAERQLDSAGD